MAEAASRQRMTSSSGGSPTSGKLKSSGTPPKPAKISSSNASDEESIGSAFKEASTPHFGGTPPKASSDEVLARKQRLIKKDAAAGEERNGKRKGKKKVSASAPAATGKKKGKKEAASGAAPAGKKKGKKVATSRAAAAGKKKGKKKEAASAPEEDGEKNGKLPSASRPETEGKMKRKKDPPPASKSARKMMGTKASSPARQSEGRMRGTKASSPTRRIQAEGKTKLNTSHSAIRPPLPSKTRARSEAGQAKQRKPSPGAGSERGAPKEEEIHNTAPDSSCGGAAKPKATKKSMGGRRAAASTPKNNKEVIDDSAQDSDNPELPPRESSTDDEDSLSHNTDGDMESTESGGVLGAGHLAVTKVTAGSPEGSGLATASSDSGSSTSSGGSDDGFWDQPRPHSKMNLAKMKCSEGIRTSKSSLGLSARTRTSRPSATSPSSLTPQVTHRKMKLAPPSLPTMESLQDIARPRCPQGAHCRQLRDAEHALRYQHTGGPAGTVHAEEDVLVVVGSPQIVTSSTVEDKGGVGKDRGGALPAAAKDNVGFACSVPSLVPSPRHSPAPCRNDPGLAKNPRMKGLVGRVRSSSLGSREDLAPKERKQNAKQRRRGGMRLAYAIVGFSSDDKGRKQPVKGPLISCLNDFPREHKVLIRSAKLPVEQLEANVDILLNVLYFQKKVCFEGEASAKPEPWPQPVPTAFARHPIEELVCTDVNPFKSYRMIKLAGEGGYGRIHRATSMAKGHKGSVAVKKMDHKAGRQQKRNEMELNVLSFAEHPCIVQYHASYLLKNELWVVMEFMEGGTLAEAAKRHRFTEPQIAYCAREALKAIAYLHSQQLVHRDLKSANIMLTTSGHVKLIDFGLAVCVSDGPKRDMVGSPFWMAPEMVQRRYHSFPVDIWCFGISLLELANQVPPHRKSSLRAMFLYGSEGLRDPFADVSKWGPTFQEFIQACLNFEPGERPSAEELRQHKFCVPLKGKGAVGRKQMSKVLKSVFIEGVIEDIGMGI